MSLVNEALRKARTQAAVQRATQSPLAHLATPTPYSPSKSRTSLVLVIAIACVFVGVLSASVVHLTKTPPAPLMAQVAAIQPRVSLPTPPRLPSEISAPAESKPQATAPTPAAAPEAPISDNDNSTPTPPAPVSTLVEGKAYLQSIDLPGVPKLKLDGILWSEQKPSALINGSIAAVGDDLGDVIVVAIEPKRVKLQSQGKDFFLRLP